MNKSLLKLIKRLTELIHNIIKSLIERLTKLLKAVIYSIFVLVKSLLEFMKGLIEGHIKLIKSITKSLIHLRHIFCHRMWYRNSKRFATPADPLRPMDVCIPARTSMRSRRFESLAVPKTSAPKGGNLRATVCQYV